MKWYWWILIVVLALNGLAIAMLVGMMISDWLGRRRRAKRRSARRADSVGEVKD